MITQEEVQKHMRYKDGKLFWRIPTGPRGVVGKEVGCPKENGYRHTRFRGKLRLVHRLIFLYHYGYLPENQIDHINRIRDDNRIENLREVSQSCNLRNSETRTDNTSGIKGVLFHTYHKKWAAQIALNGRNKHLGYHDTKLEAACHRLAGEQCLDWNTCEAESPAYKYVKENL